MKQKQQQNPRTVAIGCATVFLCGLVFVGLFFYINHTYTAPFKQLARDICNEYGCDANDLINNHMDELQLCEMPVTEDLDYSVICLEGRGVNIID